MTTHPIQFQYLKLTPGSTTEGIGTMSTADKGKDGGIESAGAELEPMIEMDEDGNTAERPSSGAELEPMVEMDEDGNTFERPVDKGKGEEGVVGKEDVVEGAKIEPLVEMDESGRTGERGV